MCTYFLGSDQAFVAGVPAVVALASMPLSVGVAFRSEDPIDICVGEQLVIVAVPPALARPGIVILEELCASIHLQTVLVVCRLVLGLGDVGEL